MKNILNTDKKAKPVLWDHVEVISYLRAYYDYRKQQSADFSYAIWASELQIKSRSFLRLLLTEKRSLTEDMAANFTHALKLNQKEIRYFNHLVALARTTKIESQELHGRELLRLRQKFALKGHELVEVNEADLFEFLSSYQMPRLQVLLSLNDIDKSAANFAKLLSMTEDKVAELLTTLKNLGLAKQNEQGQWEANEAKLATPDALGNIALQSFHKKSLEEAVQAISSPKETRRYQSLVMALTQEQFEELHKDLRLYLAQTLKNYDSNSGKNKKVYQINLNMIPVTGPIIREETCAPVESDEKDKGTKV